MRVFTLILGILGVLATPSMARAQLIVGVDNPTVPVYMIDVGTGDATPLSTPGPTGGEVWGMAADDANRYLYYNSGITLYRVSYDTLVPEEVGPITYQGSSTSMVSLAFNPGTGMLYGTKNIATEGVYEIDPATGVADLVWAYASADFDFGGIDYDTTTGSFYGLNDDATPQSGLFSIDPFGQSTSFIVGYPGGETDLDGLATGGGKAYFVNDEPGVFYVYNLLTNMFEDPIDNPWTTSEVFSGAAWAPGLIPAPSALALLVAAGIVGRRRRR